MPTRFEEGVNILIFLLLLSGFQATLGRFGLVGCGVIIYDKHVVNNVHLLCLQVFNENTPL